ncbi:MAG: hypothetical protein ACI9K2_006223 [Myxococcota bacterium]|jgi:hypothetical protein
MWTMLMLSALAREPVRGPAVATPGEAYFVLDQRRICTADVVVGPDGRAVDARATNCSAVLHEAIEAAALRARWSPASERSLEAVEVWVRPPARPRRRGACLVALDPPRVALAHVPRRCLFDAGDRGMSITEDFGDGWCTVDVDPGAETPVTVTACSPGHADRARFVADGWTFPEGHQTWRVLLRIIAQNDRLIDYALD